MTDAGKWKRLAKFKFSSGFFFSFNYEFTPLARGVGDKLIHLPWIKSQGRHVTTAWTGSRSMRRETLNSKQPCRGTGSVRLTYPRHSYYFHDYSTYGDPASKGYIKAAFSQSHVLSKNIRFREGVWGHFAVTLRFLSQQILL